MACRGRTFSSVGLTSGPSLPMSPVTCCSDTSLASFSPPRNATITYPNGTAVVSLCPVWAERDFGQGGAACGRSLSYADAVTFCSAQSARLCTQPELEASCGSTLGCGHNNAVIWSSTVRQCERVRLCKCAGVL
jgi:hypothetical protein